MACASEGRPSTSAEIASGSIRLRTTMDGLATTMTARARSPPAAARWRRNTRHTSASCSRIADPGIQHRIQQIDHEIGHDHRGPAYDEDGEHDRIVALHDRAEREQAHARPREDHLGHDGAR